MPPARAAHHTTTSGRPIPHPLPPQPILIVTGKGGVGKSTVAASLALRSAGAGERTLVVEVSGADRIPSFFGRSAAPYSPEPLTDDLPLWHLTLTPEAAIEEHVVQQIRFARLYDMVFRNRVMGPFLDAIPGLHDAVQLGKIFDLWRQGRTDRRPLWDRVVVDAPATGHGLTMLASCRSMMELTRSGPFYEEVRQVEVVMSDPERTALILVCLPEEMPVRETVELWERLGGSRRCVSRAVMNLLAPPPFALDDAEADWAVARSVLGDLSDPAIAGAVALTQTRLDRALRQRAATERLTQTLGVPLDRVPWLPSDGGDLRREDLERVGACLGAA